MNPSALASFNNQRLGVQYTLFGSPIKINTVEGIGCYDAPRFQKILRDGGEVIGADCTLKIRKSDWLALTSDAKFEKAVVSLQLDGGWRNFRVATVIDSHFGAEWKLELEVAN